MNIRKILESGRTMRYHACLIEKKQSVAEHHWETALILKKIYPEADAALILYALTHDSGEIHVSDVAAPVKRQSPQLKKLLDKLEAKYIEEELGILHNIFSQEEYLAVKYADVLSGLYFTSTRVRAGDQEAVVIRDRWIEYLKEMPYLNDRVYPVIEELRK